MFFQRKFFPFFLTQFFGAFNDNLFKNALVILITYRISVKEGLDPSVLVTLSAGIFILPFFLFSAIAAKVSGAFPQTGLVRKIKTAEVLIALCGGIGFYFENTWILLFVLFLLGIQSAFFGPLKYSMLPSLLSAKPDLVLGNAYFSAGTFLAILLGTIFGSEVILAQQGIFWVSFSILVFALIGRVTAGFVPDLPFDSSQREKLPRFLFGSLWEMMTLLRSKKVLMQLVYASSWFWFMGSGILSQLPTFYGKVMKVEQTVFTLNLTLFSIGVGVGSMIGYRMNRRSLNTRRGFWALILMSLALFDFFWQWQVLSQNDLYLGSEYRGIDIFYQDFANIRMSFDLFLFSVFGGFYFVPIMTFLEILSSDSLRPKTIATTNLYNALLMVISAVAIAAVQQFSDTTIPQIFLCLGVLNLAVAFIYKRGAFNRLPETEA